MTTFFIILAVFFILEIALFIWMYRKDKKEKVASKGEREKIKNAFTEYKDQGKKNEDEKIAAVTGNDDNTSFDNSINILHNLSKK